MTGRAIYRLNRSLISWSEARSLGPEWYQPIIRSRAAESLDLALVYSAFLHTIDLLEHLPHALDIVMVQKPSFWILLVLFKRNAERVGDIDGFPIVLS